MKMEELLKTALRKNELPDLPEEVLEDFCDEIYRKTRRIGECFSFFSFVCGAILPWAWIGIVKGFHTLTWFVLTTFLSILIPISAIWIMGLVSNYRKISEREELARFFDKFKKMHIEIVEEKYWLYSPGFEAANLSWNLSIPWFFFLGSTILGTTFLVFGVDIETTSITSLLASIIVGGWFFGIVYVVHWILLKRIENRIYNAPSNN